MADLFPGGSVVKNPPANAGRGVQSLGQKIPWRRIWQPTLVFLPGKLHGWRGLVHYKPWGHKSVGHNLATEQEQQQRVVYPLLGEQTDKGKKITQNWFWLQKF